MCTCVYTHVRYMCTGTCTYIHYEFTYRYTHIHVMYIHVHTRTTYTCMYVCTVILEVRSCTVPGIRSVRVYTPDPDQKYELLKETTYYILHCYTCTPCFFKKKKRPCRTCGTQLVLVHVHHIHKQKKSYIVD